MEAFLSKYPQLKHHPSFQFLRTHVPVINFLLRSNLRFFSLGPIYVFRNALIVLIHLIFVIYFNNVSTSILTIFYWYCGCKSRNCWCAFILLRNFFRIMDWCEDFGNSSVYIHQRAWKDLCSVRKQLQLRLGLKHEQRQHGLTKMFEKDCSEEMPNTNQAVHE